MAKNGNTVRITEEANRIVEEMARKENTSIAKSLENLIKLVNNNILVIVDNPKDFRVEELEYLSDCFADMQKDLKAKNWTCKDVESSKSVSAAHLLITNLQNALFLIGHLLQAEIDKINKNGGEN